MKSSVTVVDYGMGNIWSICSAIRYLGFNPIVSSSPTEIEAAGVIVLPGVGSFRTAMESLRSRRIDEGLREAIKGRGSKILGVCLGMQLLAQFGSEDGETEGLGVIDGRVDRFDPTTMGELKVPHIGFNEVFSSNKSILFKSIPQSSDFYFVHSYRMLADVDNGGMSVCRYGETFVAAYEHLNIFATQFHPEKSQTNGLLLLQNFLNI